MKQMVNKQEILRIFELLVGYGKYQKRDILKLLNEMYDVGYKDGRHDKKIIEELK